MAMKKKEMGSDRGAKAKANAAEKKKQANASASKYKPGSPNYYYDNLSAPRKKALGYGGKTDLAGLNTNLQGMTGATKTRTSQRGVDQAKRAGVKAAKKANKK
jgi:hypothetical protein